MSNDKIRTKHGRDYVYNGFHFVSEQRAVFGVPNGALMWRTDNDSWRTKKGFLSAFQDLHTDPFGQEASK